MGWKGEMNRSATFFVASNNWRSMWLKSPKWYLIACQILLPNFLVFPCEIEREFHVGSKFTQSIMLHTIYICILYISWKSLWQSFTSCGCDNFSFQVFSQIFLIWKFFKLMNLIRILFFCWFISIILDNGKKANWSGLTQWEYMLFTVG